MSLPKQDESARLRLISTLRAMRPEHAAGGFTRDDGTLHFYTRINALLSPASVLLDYGAGRGRQFDVPDPGYLQVLQNFQGRVAKVIGVDVGPAISEHPHLDERHIIDPDAEIPLGAGSVDIVVADWVLEHLAHPAHFCREMERLIKPGGWLCARTVNRWGYVGIGARLIPNRIHSRLVRRLIPVARGDDVFPTVYRLNTLGAIRRWLPATRWRHCSFLMNTTPRYFGNSKLLFRATDVCQRLLPNALHTDLFVFVQRK